MVSFISPSHWLVSVCFICVTAVLIHFLLWLRFRRDVNHPSLIIQRVWLRRGIRHAVSLSVYAVLSELLNSTRTYEWWNHIRIDSTTAKIAAAFISDIQFLLTLFAACMIWVYSFRQIRVSLYDGFATPVVEELDEALDRYYLIRESVTPEQVDP